MKNENILICTTKSWNIKNYQKIKDSLGKYNWHIINDKNELKYKKVVDINPKYIFFPHWSWKIPKKIHKNFLCIAFHMTDLPFGRGGSPLQNLIIRGYKKTKITAFKVTEELDAGPIFLKEELSLDGSAEEIYKRTSELIFFELIPSILKKSIKPSPQKGKTVFFQRRKANEGDISKLNDLEKIYDYIRMLDSEGYPKAFFEKNNIKIEFEDAKKNDNKITAKAKIKVKEKK